MSEKELRNGETKDLDLMKKNELYVCITWNGNIFTEGKTYYVENDRIIGENGYSYKFSSNVAKHGIFHKASKLHKALK